MCILYKFLTSWIHWGLEPGKLSRYESLGVILIERKNLIFPLSSYILTWPHPLVVISKAILIDTGGNILLCHQVSRSRNQWYTRNVIPTKVPSDWKRFSGKICLVMNLCLKMMWPLNSSITYSCCCCCRCCYRVWNMKFNSVRFGFILIWGKQICSYFNVNQFKAVNWNQVLFSIFLKTLLYLSWVTLCVDLWG